MGSFGMLPAKPVAARPPTLRCKIVQHLKLILIRHLQNKPLSIKDLREDPIAYVLQNPRWMLGRIDTNDNALYVVNEDNTLVRVSRITKTATSGDPYGSDAYHRTTVELVDGTSREVDSGYLVHTPLRSPKIA